VTELLLTDKVTVNLFLVTVYKSLFVPSTLHSSSSPPYHIHLATLAIKKTTSRPLSTTMSNNNGSSSVPLVLPVLVPSLLGQPSRRPYVVMSHAEEHLQELLDFLKDALQSARERNEVEPSTCEAGFAHNKIILVASSVAELESVKDEAIKAELAARLDSVKKRLQEVRDLLRI
jgi:hypothetical protein